MTNISLDIEACGEVVLSVGACVFDPATGEVGSVFYVALDPCEQMERGLKMDGEAFLWWLRQNDETRIAIAGAHRLPPGAALDALRRWWPERDARTWCYPTSYDLPVLARACAAFKVRPPWKWTATLDVRTLWKLACDADPAAAEIERDKGPDEHNALADAKRQAQWASRYLAVLGVLGPTMPPAPPTPEAT